jgi:glycosyltransferase involved in cell wall biosynthesis
MESGMTISVAIATFGRARMVERAVLAALAQIPAPLEVVVFDDASLDDTVERLRRLAEQDPRIRVFRQPVNTGGVPNWNAAIEQTRGDLIAWCSDDDWFLEGHLARSAAYLEAHPECGLVHSHFVDAVMKGEECEFLPRPLRSAEPIRIDTRSLLPYMIRYYDWPFHPSTIVMRREVWKAAGPFDARHAFADTDWFLRAVEYAPAVMLAAHGVVNRRHAGNWSNRMGSARLQRELFEMVEEAIARRRRFRGFWRAVWRANVRVRLLLTLRARLRTGHRDAACAAWHGLLQDSGRRTPAWIERAGIRWIERRCFNRTPEFRDARESVSPL